MKRSDFFQFTNGTKVQLPFSDKEYENRLKGLRKIITDIKKRGAKIILCTPTVIGERVTFEDELEIKRDQELDAFSGVVRNLASEFNTELLDLRTIFKDYIAENNKNNEYQDFLTVDGVHLNDAGNKLLSEKMLNYIN